MPKICLFKPCSIVIALLVLFAFTGCKKAKTTTIYDFSYSGSPYVDDNISFTITPSSGSKFLWDFKDGHTSALANPVHSYSVAGSYVVSLVVNDDSAHKITKTLKIGFDSTLMSALIGLRVYHHTDEFDRNIVGGGDSSIITTYADITVAIVNIDPVTILFGSDSLYLSSFSSGVAVFFYSHEIGKYNTLSFNTATNNISYERHSGSAGSGNVESYDYP